MSHQITSLTFSTLYLQTIESVMFCVYLIVHCSFQSLVTCGIQSRFSDYCRQYSYCILGTLEAGINFSPALEYTTLTHNLLLICNAVMCTIFFLDIFERTFCSQYKVNAEPTVTNGFCGLLYLFLHIYIHILEMPFAPNCQFVNCQVRCHSKAPELCFDG